MHVSDFHYDLPEELIAQHPGERGASRMLVISRDEQTFYDDMFSNFNRYVKAGDCLVLNNSRVLPARLHGRRNTASGGAVEIFLLREQNDPMVWKCLVKPGKRVAVGDTILIGDELRGEVLERGGFGERTMRFSARRPLRELFEELGETPLPPYIQRRPEAGDRERYQTVFAAQPGSVAAPTAGLHFTPEMLEACRAGGAKVAQVCLHVGLGTFAPIRNSKLADVRLHEEYFEINEAAAAAMRAGKRLFCVGTTAVRTVETAMLRGGLKAMTGETSLFIQPGFQFRATGAMLTNFHLPQSSLLMLVSAFAGRELVLAAYRHAVAAQYKFFSFGDCMVIV